MKKCSKCKEIKSNDNFYWSKQKNNLYSQCKLCTLNSKRGYKEPKDKLYSVYILPSADYYVGQTNRLKVRMREHRYIRKYKTDDVIILHECNTRKEAEWFECVYHDLGFPGRHIKKSPTKR